MRVRKLVPIFLSVVLLLLIFSSFALAEKIPGTPGHGGTPLTAELTDEAELDGGDVNDDAGGTALITLNQGQGEVCFLIQVSNLSSAVTAAHIHRGEADVNGPVVIGLAPPVGGESSGCVYNTPTGPITKDLIKEIRQNPEKFYVNVHTTANPSGAVRGQLAK